MSTATVSLRPEGSDEEVRSLLRWLRDEDDLRGRVNAAEPAIADGGMGGLVDAVVLVLTGGTAPVLVRSLFGWLAHRRAATKVSLRVKANGKEAELTCGSADDAQTVLAALRAHLDT